MQTTTDRRKLARVHCALELVLICSLMSVGSLPGQTIGELETENSEFVSRARELYRFDEEKLEIIWAAYCGELDTDVPGGKEIAGDVGHAFQRDGQGRLDQLMAELARIRGAAEKLEQEDSIEARARVVLADLEREERNLVRIANGVVLRGSNHPFTQYAIEHGKKMHLEGCDEFEQLAPVCDQPYPTISRQRPDLVTVTSDGKLMVYEFKPEGQESKAENEAREYAPGVQKYYQDFFPEGRTCIDRRHS